MTFLLVFPVLAIALPVTAVVGTIAWAFPTRRASIVQRYPLVAATTLIVLPLLYGLLCVVYYGLNEDRSPSDDAAAPFIVLIGAAGVVLCVTVVVQAIRAALGRYEKGPYLPAIIGFSVGGVVTVLSLGAGIGAGGAVFAVYGVALTLAFGTSGLMAQWVNTASREKRLAAGLMPVEPAPLG